MYVLKSPFGSFTVSRVHLLIACFLPFSLSIPFLSLSHPLNTPHGAGTEFCRFIWNALWILDYYVPTAVFPLHTFATTWKQNDFFRYLFRGGFCCNRVACVCVWVCAWVTYQKRWIYKKIREECNQSNSIEDANASKCEKERWNFGSMRWGRHRVWVSWTMCRRKVRKMKIALNQYNRRICLSRIFVSFSFSIVFTSVSATVCGFCLISAPIISGHRLPVLLVWMWTVANVLTRHRCYCCSTTMCIVANRILPFIAV